MVGGSVIPAASSSSSDLPEGKSPDFTEKLREVLVEAVYEKVRKQFYDWDGEYCAVIMNSLGPITPSGGRTTSEDANFDDEVFSPSHDDDSMPLEIQEIHQYRVIRYSSNGEPATETVSCPTYTFPTMEPGRPYEACTFSHKSIYIADDVCEKLPFVPFADNPQFPVQAYINAYDEIAWEAQKDPDEEVIVAEAARRLHFENKYTFSDIDKTGILPFPIIESSGKKGLLQILNQRDLPCWDGSQSSDLPPLPRSEGPPPTDLKRRVNGLRYLFCANLNCVEPYCPTHLNMAEEIRYSSGDHVDGDAEAQKEPPCGDECYKHLNCPEESLLCWDEATLEDFKFIHQGASELSSCDLAILCDKPCQEIYAYRRKYFPRPPEDFAPSSMSESESGSDSGRERLIFVDTVRNARLSVSIPPFEICQHTGKCDALADCRCYRKSLHCHRNCNCDLSCARRPKGCYCKNSGRKMCRTMKCPCYRAGRECDPELCKKCGAKYASVMNRCRNNDLQHGRTKAIEVKEGTYGLGLFLTEPAREGDLIGEYVGEILSDRMTEARGLISRHLGRNYLFELNAEWMIDAAFVGNETRFINHAGGNLANCRAEVREVNGDHRIGIYVVKKQLEPGEEIFMDYGQEYFQSASKAGDNTTEI